MSENFNLIPVSTSTINHQRTLTCDGRALHEFLESKQHYTDWIKKRIEKYGFVEGIDFIIHKKMINDTICLEVVHTLSIDMAKQLAMVENNDRGAEVRRYFVECERRVMEAPVFHCTIDRRHSLTRQTVQLLKKHGPLTVKGLAQMLRLEDTQAQNIFSRLRYQGEVTRIDDKIPAAYELILQPHPVAVQPLKNLQERIIFQLQKNGGKASARDIYKHIHGSPSGAAKAELLRMQKDGLVKYVSPRTWVLTDRCPQTLPAFAPAFLDKCEYRGHPQERDTDYADQKYEMLNNKKIELEDEVMAITGQGIRESSKEIIELHWLLTRFEDMARAFPDALKGFIQLETKIADYELRLAKLKKLMDSGQAA